MSEVSSDTMREIVKRIDENVVELKGEVIGLKNESKKTNGRIKGIEIWKAKVIGALLVMNLVFIPIVIIVLENYLTN